MYKVVIDPIRILSLKKWILSLLDGLPGNHLHLGRPDTNDLAHLFHDGSVLCRIVNKLKPGILGDEEWVKEPQSSSQKEQNIRVFLNCLRKYFSVPEELLFQPYHVSQEGESINSVILTLLHLMVHSLPQVLFGRNDFSVKPPEDDSEFSGLKWNISGELILPSSQVQYSLSRVTLNKNTNALPRAIVRPNHAGDVSAAIKFANKHKWIVDVKSRGHCTSGFGIQNNCLLIDFSLMTGIFFNEKLEIATIQAGASWVDVQRAVSPFLVVGPHDSGSGVGALLSGASGPMSNSHGLPLDMLISAEVIMSDGELKTVKEGQHSAVFWALRGAGPLSYGIVTSYCVELSNILVPYEGNVHVTTREWYLSDATKVLRYWQRLFLSTSSFNRSIITIIKLSVLHGLCMQNVYLGNPAEGPKAFSFFDVPNLVHCKRTDHVIPFWRWYAAQEVEDRGFFVSTGGGFVDGLDDDLIGCIVATANHPVGGHCEVQIEFMSGAVTEVLPEDTAYPHRKKSVHVLLTSRYRTNEDTWKTWTKEFSNRVKEKSFGVCLAHADPGLSEEEYPSLYWGQNYPLLQHIKTSVDQHNFFNYPQGIKPMV
eukprot:TRINITY_DN4426_c0_g1_i6.p1 TRINITY_DN4426_c0_g1~~TRINITY_DN4426_c0_g1_i6.p1  ORF type:complete len:594 (+),score=111.58 TRINITY_DN4426_c0_g1_i6:119-1900(+)